MKIDSNLLLTWGAVAKKYKKNEVIFHEEEEALFFYQILLGKVKMVNINDDGKEFIQGIFNDDNSFGEPPLFINKKYPCSAIAQKDSVIIKISKDSIYKLFREYPDLQWQFIQILSERIYNKAITARELIHNKPENKILAFLKNYKQKAGLTNEDWLVPHTRQEVANLLGLRVETVIRALKKMEVKGQVKIINHKLYF
ncbi:MAG: Crp/Fnr family transcriptional regulator [Candidatus Methylacidiphilales bacterium]